jgi:hypothetical protein
MQQPTQQLSGYHEDAPSANDDAVVTQFFGASSAYTGVCDGESIRHSWQLANESIGYDAKWAVLVFQSNNNQYYRMPGFPGQTYTAPNRAQPVFRYWNSYTSGQAMTTTVTPPNLNLAMLPTELSLASARLSVNDTAVSSSISNSTFGLARNSEQITSREMAESASSLDKGTQDAIATAFISNAIGTTQLTGAILTESEVIREEIDPEIGLVVGSETIVGNTYCYWNQYGGIRIADSFVKVGTDVEGVYFFINNWKNIESIAGSASTSAHSGKTPVRIAYDEALVVIGIKAADVKDAEVVYAPLDDDTYRLSYEIRLFDGGVMYVDCETGSII